MENQLMMNLLFNSLSNTDSFTKGFQFHKSAKELIDSDKTQSIS